MIEILYKSKNAIVIYKPAGIPSQPDPGGDRDALSLAADLLSSLGEKTELHPIHRLDRVVAGLLVIARNKQTAARLSALVSGEGLGKEYFAVVEGKASEGELVDYLIKNSAAVKAAVVKQGAPGAKLARLSYRSLASVETDQGARTLVSVKLDTGRFHQIRAQLSSRGIPIVGDKKYGSKDYQARIPALFSHKLEIPLGAELITVQKLPPLSDYPWNLFQEENFI